MIAAIERTAIVAIIALALAAWIADAARAQPAPPPPETPAAPAAPESPPPPDEELARARALYEAGKFAEARAVLLEAYQRHPHPALLFALGQVEINLGHPREAIAYYERFIATGPREDELSLAQQAIGAAQMQLSMTAAPPSPPPPRRRPPRWDAGGTWITILGGLGIAAGAGMFFYGDRLAEDETGTLSAYDARVDRARRWRWIGAGAAAAGTLAIGAAIVRWRISGGVELTATARAGGAAVSLERPW